MSDDIKRMDIAEFRELGFLQEANRQFFHPLGLALEVTVADDDTTTLTGVRDYRADPEGYVFVDLTDDDASAKAESVRFERDRHVEARMALLDGYVVQPLGTTVSSEDIKGRS